MTNKLKTSAIGIALIEQFEELRLVAYQDPAGIWTIGYGHANARKDQYETKEQAEADLCQDLETAETAVNYMVHAQLNQNQFDAVVSFTFNEGSGRLRASTLLRLLNAGSFALAAAEFPKWDVIAHDVSQGLLRRRMAEQALFLKAAA